MARTLVQAAAVVTMNDAGDVHEPGHLGVEGDRIAYVGDEAPSGADWATAERIDATACCLIPGLVNAHTHSGMTTMRGVADDRPLMEWLEGTIWPMEARLSAEDIYWGSMLGIAEMLRGGVTTMGDLYMHSEQTARACAETGMRAVLGGALFGVRPDADRQLEEARATAAAVRDMGERVDFWLAPHAVYTCPPAFLERVVELATALGAGIQTHLAEAASEVADCKRQHGGRTPAEVMCDAGVFTRPTVAAHCVHMTEADAEILAEHGASVAHMPAANMKLAVGIADIGLFERAGVNIALGTDGAASNNNLSILNEMRIAALVQKVHTGDPASLSAGRALEMATRGGATALGLADRIGQLTVGFVADFALVRQDAVSCAPSMNAISNLAYSLGAHDVDTVFIAGEPVVRDGRFLALDEREVKARAREVIDRIRA